jgi:F-type H+-transporting ATPase subunit b
MKRALLSALLSGAVLFGWGTARAQDHEQGEHAPAAEGHGEHGDEHGAAHGHGAEPLNFANFDGPGIPLVAMLFNFAALIAILIWLGKKPLKEFLMSRHVGIRDALADAQRTRAEAEGRYKRYSERLDHLDRELDRLREEMSTVAQAERDRIVADAEERAARLQRESEFLLSQEIKQVRKDLERDLAVAAIAAAEEVLRRVTTEQDQARLAEVYLDALGKETPGGSA